MPNTDRDRTIALAGMFQATALVRDIAHDGQYDNQEFTTCIESLFHITVADSEQIYGDLARLRRGLNLVRKQLSEHQNPELTRYVVVLMTLERKLSRQPRLLQTLGDGIQSTQQRLEHFPLTHDNIIAGLADLYTETVSTLRPRIMVNGHYQHLSQAGNANRIRALLLAGIRAAVLWHQSGGGRFKLLFGRKRLLAAAHQLVATLAEKPNLHIVR